MSRLLNSLLESDSRAFNEAVESIFNSLFEEVTVNSKDAVQMLQQKVGENVHKTDDGENIVGLAAQAGMGDEPLPNDMDKIVNDVNLDMAKDIDLPTEQELPDLPDEGGTVAEDEFGGDDDMDWDDTNLGQSIEELQKPLGNPPPDDMELPLLPDDDGAEIEIVG
jgi:hypothetical protein